MKYLIITGCVLALISCANTTTKTEDCCSADKDSYEIVMNIPQKIKPEFVSAYKAAFEECRSETLKEETCLAYELFESYKDSTEFHLFERWGNKPGHQAHMKTPHIAVFFEKTKDMRDKSGTEKVITTVCPHVNAK
ncbi:putative quinol monooxygenase [Dysgonomonas reticulitermitis]